jgi:hypothetical protein
MKRVLIFALALFFISCKKEMVCEAFNANGLIGQPIGWKSEEVYEIEFEKGVVYVAMASRIEGTKNVSPSGDFISPSDLQVFIYQTEDFNWYFGDGSGKAYLKNGVLKLEEVSLFTIDKSSKFVLNGCINL